MRNSDLSVQINLIATEFILLSIAFQTKYLIVYVLESRSSSDGLVPTKYINIYIYIKYNKIK